MKKIAVLCFVLTMLSAMFCIGAADEYEYTIGELTLVDLFNRPVGYKGGSCSVKVDVSRNFVRSGADADSLVISAYDTDANMIGFYVFSTESFSYKTPSSVSCLINVDKATRLGRIKAYIWDDFNNFSPLSQAKSLVVDPNSAEPVDPTPKPTPEPTTEPTAPPLPDNAVRVDGTLIAANDGTDRVCGISDGVMRIKTSKTSSSITSYRLSDDAILFVNGVEYITIMGNEDAARDLIADSTGGTILVDSEKTGAYDRVEIDYYVIAGLNAVKWRDGIAQLALKDLIYDSWLIARPGYIFSAYDKTISVTRLNAEAELNDLQLGDVLAVRYDINGSIDDSPFVDIIATNETVSGKYTDYNDETEEYTIAGKDYSSVFNIDMDMNIGGEYKLYLDPFGRIFDYYEISNGKNYAIIESYVDVSKSTSSSSDTDYMRVVTLDGQAKTLYVDAGYQYMTRNMINYRDIGINPSSTRAPMNERIIEYAVKESSGKVIGLSFVDNEVFYGMEYKASSNRLFKLLSENVTILDATRYDEGNKSLSDYRAASLDMLGEGIEYDGILFDRNENYDYRYLIITKAGSIFNAGSEFVIAAADGSINAQAQVDGVDGKDVYTLNVMKDGNYRAEKINISMTADIYFQNNRISIDDIKRGSMFVYTTNNYGFIDEINVLYMGVSNYSELLSTTTEEANNRYLSLPRPENIREADWLITMNDRNFTVDANSNIMLTMGIAVHSASNYVGIAPVYKANDGFYADFESTEMFSINSNSEIYRFDMSYTGTAAFEVGNFNVRINKALLDDGRAWIYNAPEEKYDLSESVNPVVMVVVDGFVKTALVMDY